MEVDQRNNFPNMLDISAQNCVQQNVHIQFVLRSVQCVTCNLAEMFLSACSESQSIINKVLLENQRYMSFMVVACQIIDLTIIDETHSEDACFGVPVIF